MGYSVGVSSTPKKPSHHGPGHAVTRFFSNLGHDIKDAAVGLPRGLVETVRHPVRTAEEVGKTTWQTWSPLFHGEFQKFGKQTYDHPLAPLLDVMTVFTGGAGLAAKTGAKLAEHSVIADSSRLAKLGTPTKHVFKDASKKNRGALPKYTSENPLVRHGQKQMFKLMKQSDEHLPTWFNEHVFGTQATFNKLHRVDMAHRHAAMNMQIAAAMKAGQALDKIGQLGVAEHEIFAHNYFSLLRHAREIKATDALPEGYSYVREYNGRFQGKFFYENKPSQDFGQFRKRLANFGRRYTVKDASKAAKARNGKFVKIVPTHDVRNLELEAERSATFLRAMYRAPTRLWKTILLGYSPRVVINNGVGNWFMYALRQGGGHSVRGFVDAVRFAKGEKEARRVVGVMHRQRSPHWLREFFGDELGNTFGTVLREDGKEAGKLSQGLYPLVHSLADQPVRAASISAYLRAAPEVKRLQKQHGWSFDKAAREAVRRSPDLRNKASLHARKIAGDYFTMSPAERVLRDIVPFYLWDKHIVQHVGNLALERPGRLALMAAIGKEGAEKTRMDLGDIPDFMLNLIPLPGHSGDRKPMLSTIGLNPYATIPELYDLGQALTTGGDLKAGEVVGGQINPLIAQFIEQVSGHRLTSDSTPKQMGGVIPSVGVNVAESLPAVQLLEKVAGVGGFTPKTPTLYAHDLDEIISSLAGIPVKKANMGRAHDLAAERGQARGVKKKKRKRRKSGYSVGR